MWTEAIVALVVVVVSIGLYYAITGTPPGARIIEEDPPVDNGLGENQAKFMYFYASWCPYCKKAEQQVRSLKQLITNNGYVYGGKHVTFEEINGETDKGKKALYHIKAYPTFKIETAEKVYTLVGRPSVETFREFLQKALGSEKSTH